MYGEHDRFNLDCRPVIDAGNRNRRRRMYRRQQLRDAAKRLIQPQEQFVAITQKQTLPWNLQQVLDLLNSDLAQLRAEFDR